MPLSRRVRLNPLLLKIGAAAEKAGTNAYLVGGAVRDMMTGDKDLDLDIVTEGDPGPAAKAAAKLVRGKIRSYERFGTLTVETRKGSNIDFATARKETYRRSGALPDVVFSDIEHDLFRRDFTINALAVRLGGGKTGSVVDLFGGVRDLNNRVLRVLHGKSFRDDPTRIFRLARFAGRGYRIDRLTEKLAAEAAGAVGKISPERSSREIFLILEEKEPLAALDILRRFGILEKLLPGVDISRRLLSLNRIKGLEKRLAFLFSEVGKSSRLKLYSNLRFTNKLKNSIEKQLQPKKHKAALNGNDLIKMGYKQGPLIGKILESLSRRRAASKRIARRFVFDNFPQKI